MIRYKDEIIEDYECDYENGKIKDKDGEYLEEIVIKGRPHVSIKHKTKVGIKFRKIAVHQLICHTYYGYKGKDFDVHHVNEDKLDNRLCNLQYIHRDVHGMITRANGFKRWREKNKEQWLKNCSKGR